MKDPARARARLLSASMGALSMLVLQFVLGIGVNLYVTVSPGGPGKAFSNGPLLALHAALGLLLIIAAIDLLVRAVLARHRALIATSAVGLLAVLAAAGGGMAFVKNGQDGASMAMAVATGVAMLCYGASLRILGTAGWPGRGGGRPAPG